MQPYTAGDVTNLAAAFLNDQDHDMYTFDVQLPYLKSAQDELEQNLILNECQISMIDELIIPVEIGDIELTLPKSFFLPITLHERAANTTSEFTPMREKKFVNEITNTKGTSLGIWDYRHNCINFVGATSKREIRLVYYRTIPMINDCAPSTSSQLVQGAKNTLAFRTAALCAKYIGGNAERSGELNMEAMAARELLISIFVKSNQVSLRSRRKPFGVVRHG